MTADWYGDEEFARLYREYERPVQRLATRLVGVADAPDVVQEVMLRAWRARPEISDEREVWPWLHTVTRNVCVDVLRRRRDVPAPELTIEDLLPLVPDEPASAAVRSDARRRLRAAIGLLPTQDAEMLVWHELNGASAAEIAAAHGSNPNAVRQKLLRVRKAVVRHYQAAGGALPALVPCWPALRRLLRMRRPARTSHALPLATGVAVIAALVATDHRPECVFVPNLLGPAHQAMVPVGDADPLREWVRGPLDPVPGPSINESSGLVYDEARHEYVLVSADDREGRLRTWTFTRDGWAMRQPAQPLPGLTDAGVVYDAARREVLLLGVTAETTPELQMWAWDGVDWTRRPVGDLTPREHPALAYDPARRVVVLFGGRALPGGSPLDLDAGFLDDTWLWNGETWSPVPSPVSPSQRELAAMAFDPVSRKIVLFGGRASGSVAYDDTWIWDGDTWETPVLPATKPAAAQGAAMVAMPNGPLLYGGSGIDTWTNTWRWDGDALPAAGWVREPVAAGPRLQRPNLAYDPDDDEILLVGGAAVNAGRYSTYFYQSRQGPAAAPPEPSRPVPSGPGAPPVRAQTAPDVDQERPAGESRLLVDAAERCV